MEHLPPARRSLLPRVGIVDGKPPAARVLRRSEDTGRPPHPSPGGSLTWVLVTLSASTLSHVGRLAA